MNSIIFSGINSFIFLIIQFIDYKFIKKEKISIKVLIRDVASVFIASYITIFLADILSLFFPSICKVFASMKEPKPV